MDNEQIINNHFKLVKEITKREDVVYKNKRTFKFEKTSIRETIFLRRISLFFTLSSLCLFFYINVIFKTNFNESDFNVFELIKLVSLSYVFLLTSIIFIFKVKCRDVFSAFSFCFLIYFSVLLSFFLTSYIGVGLFVIKITLFTSIIFSILSSLFFVSEFLDKNPYLLKKINKIKKTRCNIKNQIVKNIFILNRDKAIKEKNREMIQSDKEIMNYLISLKIKSSLTDLEEIKELDYFIQSMSEYNQKTEEEVLIAAYKNRFEKLEIENV